MENFESRAEMRRQTWRGSVAVDHAELATQERGYWKTASASERLDAVWGMALEAWSLKRGAEPAPRLQGSAVGIRKRAALNLESAERDEF